MSQITIHITGDEELKRALRNPALLDKPIRDFLEKATRNIEGRAKELAPVDTGRYRSSISSEVKDRQGSVISGVAYGRFIEYGTRPHWPPVVALQPWARRHGFPSAFLVARAIARRGTRAKKVFEKALDGSMGSIKGFVSDMGDDIVDQWRRLAS